MSQRLAHRDAAPGAGRLRLRASLPPLSGGRSSCGTGATVSAAQLVQMKRAHPRPFPDVYFQDVSTMVFAEFQRLRQAGLLRHTRLRLGWDAHQQTINASETGHSARDED